MDNFQNFLWAITCVNQFVIVLIIFTIPGYLNKVVDRLTGLMLAVQELCDRIWEAKS